MTTHDLIVAVDGGNSKTDLVLLRTDGSVLASVRGQGSSPHQLGLNAAVGVVGDLVDRAWLAASRPPRKCRTVASAPVVMAGAHITAGRRPPARPRTPPARARRHTRAPT